MRKIDFYEIAIKILGLYMFFSLFDILRDVITTVISITMIGTNLFENVSSTMFFTICGFNYLFVLLFGMLLTFRTNSVVKFITRSSDLEETDHLIGKKREIYEIAFVVVGMILVAWNLPHLVVYLKNQIPIDAEKRTTNWYRANTFIIVGIKIAAGTLCVIFAKRWSSFLSTEN